MSLQQHLLAISHCGKPLLAYRFDAENQLIEIKENIATIAGYRYDGLGRRIEKDVGGTITRYVYDNEDIVLEYDGANVL